MLPNQKYQIYLVLLVFVAFDKIASSQITTNKGDNPILGFMIDENLNIGKYFLKINKLEEAQQKFQSAVDLSMKLENTAKIAESTYWLAFFYFKSKNHIEAEKFYKISIDNAIKVYGETSLFLGRLYDSVALNYRLLRDFRSSEKYYTKSLIIFENQLGIDDLSCGLAKGHLSSLYFERCDYESAKKLRIESLNIYIKNLDKHDSIIILNKIDLFLIYTKLGQDNESKKVFTEITKLLSELTDEQIDRYKHNIIEYSKKLKDSNKLNEFDNIEKLLNKNKH